MQQSYLEYVRKNYLIVSVPKDFLPLLFTSNQENFLYPTSGQFLEYFFNFNFEKSGEIWQRLMRKE